MPWQTMTPMSQRLEFVRAVLHRAAGQSIKDVCAEFGVHEKTGHKWLGRYEAGGVEALADRSHAPAVPAHQVPRALVEQICALRQKQPTWGARKLRARLLELHPAIRWPAPSTFTAVLKREGLVLPRRRSHRARSAWTAGDLTQPREPNDVWAADFKGQFRVQSGEYCYPLTVSDLSARYLVGLTSLPSVATLPVEAAFQRLFAEYGLPRVIRTDNGVPFGAPLALGGLSPLGVAWIRLGIRPERIRRGQPQENGSHERMHRTLKAETTRPPAASLAAQQQRFTRWQHTFNTERPHEALGQQPPATHYTASPRPYPRRVPPLEYPAHHDLRRVSSCGSIYWRGQRIFLSEVLRSEYVSLAETADGEWTIHFGPLTLGTYSASLLAFTEALAWTPSPT